MENEVSLTLVLGEGIPGKRFSRQICFYEKRFHQKTSECNWFRLNPNPHRNHRRWQIHSPDSPRSHHPRPRRPGQVYRKNIKI